MFGFIAFFFALFTGAAIVGVRLFIAFWPVVLAIAILILKKLF